MKSTELRVFIECVGSRRKSRRKKKKRGQKGLLLFSWQQRTQTHTRHVSQSEGLMFGVINTVPVIFISCHLVHYTQTWPPRLYS